RAGCVEIHGPGVPAAQPGLDDVRGGGKGHVAGGRADHDQVDLAGLDSRALEGLLRRPDGEVGGRLGLVDDVPLADAGALDDPLVRGLHHPLELLVGEDALRGIGTDTDDLCPGHSRPPSRPSASAVSASRAVLMCSFTPLLTHSAATRTAFLIAFTGEAPWQIMEAPLIPRSGAPPISVYSTRRFMRAK